MLKTTAQEQRLKRHRDFWNRAETDRPLIGFRLEDQYIPSLWMQATASLLQTGNEILPEQLNVSEQIEEYLMTYEKYESSGQDFFWTAEPLTGIPWMEAIMGGTVVAAHDSFVIQPGTVDVRSDSFGQLDRNNPWLVKYMEYITQLDRVSDGRFPVGQPILRGPLDTLGALMTVPEMVYAFFDRPEWIQERLARLSHSFDEMIALHQQTVTPFLDGSAFGFYHLWCPAPCVWLQEDAASYLSPDLYRRYQADNDKAILTSQPCSLYHLHPSAFFLVDTLLGFDDLDVIQINRDVNGPEVEELLPVLQRILKHKKLLLWGAFSDSEFRMILETLPYRGLALQLFTDSPANARAMMTRYFSA